MIENSLIVADAYIREHAQSIRADTDAMAIDVARAKPMFDQDRERFRQFFTAQASLRDLPTAMMSWPAEALSGASVSWVTPVAWLVVTGGLAALAVRRMGRMEL
jgi:nitrogen fixation/metabolism regulation signal transduction histidine kinase